MLWSEAVENHIATARTYRDMLRVMPGDDLITRAEIKVIGKGIKEAETFALDGTIAEAITAAAQTLPDDTTILHHLLPAPSGFLYCDAPMPALQRPHDGPIRGILWTTHDEIVINRSRSTPDYSQQPLPGVVVTTLSYGVAKNVMLPEFALSWVFGRSLADYDNNTRYGLQNEQIWKFVAALFLFMDQRIVQTTRRPAARNVQRRIRDAGIDIEPVARVIELRRRDYVKDDAETSEAQERDYACQWLVRGHWRNQWYASLGTHQPKWIAPYVKGPEDKPLKQPRANVFAVVR